SMSSIPMIQSSTPLSNQFISQQNEFGKLDLLMKKVDDLTTKIEQLDFTKLLSNEDPQKKERLMSAPILLQTMQHIINQNENYRKELQREQQNIDNLHEQVGKLRKRIEQQLEIGSIDLTQREIDQLSRKNEELVKRIENLN